MKAGASFLLQNNTLRATPGRGWMEIVLNVIGLLLNAAGVILLFFFAMPYRTRSEGKSVVTVFVPTVAEKNLKQEARYDRFAITGLVAVLLGTSLQIAAALLS